MMPDEKKPTMFPRDCPRDCPHFRSWDMSIDDWTCICDLLNIQIDECDMDFRKERCPLDDASDRLGKICENHERMDIKGKKILDVTCGARTIWFNKDHPAALYCDKRREKHEHLWKNAGNCTLDINPDVLCDFTNLPFPDDSFALVIFDPPHLTGAKETSWLVKKYSKLDENWSDMLHDGFAECMRVLKPDGVLIFKWSEYDIPAEALWKAIGQKPLFGHHSGKKSTTFWGCFMKGVK